MIKTTSFTTTVLRACGVGFLTALVGACAAPAAEDRGSTDAADSLPRARVATWGMVAGAIFQDNPTAALDDMASLGLRAVRFEAPYNRTSYAAEAAFATRARNVHHMQVLVLVKPDGYLRCAQGPCPSEEAWVTEFATNVGRVAAQIPADAIELGNEPNGIEAIPASAFAKLIIRGSVAVAGRAKVVSGGLLNVNMSEPIARKYVTDLLAALPDAAPIAAFGIHPYNPGEYGQGSPAWARFVQAETAKLRASLSAKFGVSIPLWATEIGRATSRGSSGGKDNIAPASEPQAQSFLPIDAALASVVDHAFWYNYRDDEPPVKGGVGLEDFGARRPQASGGAPKPLYAVMRSALAPQSGGASVPGPAPAPAPSPAGCGKVASGSGLAPGQATTSCDGRFRLVMQGDGNLVLIMNGATVLWATYTNGQAGARAVMQGDGNFVVYGSSGSVLFDTHTNGNGGAYLAVQDDGNVVVYAGSAAVFDTHTNGH